MLPGYKRIQEALAKSETLLSMGQRLSRMGGWEWDVERQVIELGIIANIFCEEDSIASSY